MFERTAIVTRHLGQRLTAGLETLGIEVIHRFSQDHPIRARDAGWTARTLHEVWSIRRTLRPRIDPSVTHLWAVALAVFGVLIVTLVCAYCILDHALAPGMRSVM